MSEMLDRVAKELVFVQEGPCDPETVARMAIEAMREPTSEMVIAGLKCDHIDLASEWRAMIDDTLRGN